MDPHPLFPEIVSIHVQSTNHPPNISPETRPKSFAQALNRVCDIPYSQLPQAIIKGDKVSITISEEEYKVSLKNARITYTKEFSGQ